MARLGRENRFSDSNTHLIPGWSSTLGKLLTSFFAYADEPSKYFVWLISGDNSGNMTNPGILVSLILFGWCFPFVFSRRTQRTQDAKKSRSQDRNSEDGSALAKVSTGQTPYKPQKSAASLPKKQEKPTSSYAAKAAYFSAPRDLSEKDKVFQQAFRYGAR